MKPLLKALPVLVLVFAAAEAVRARLEFSYRPTEWTLFAHSVILWTAFGCLALLPAYVSLRLFRRANEPRVSAGTSSARSALVLAAWMIAPVLAHQVLDQHIGLGGDMAALKSPGPWLEILVSLVVLGLLLFGLSRLLRGRTGPRLVFSLVLLSLLAGFALPWRQGLKPHPAAQAQAPGTEEGGQRPNVLLLVWDTVRAMSTSPYHYERETTPHLADLALQGSVYEGARSVSCFTFTSHLSMFTGVLPSKHGGRLTFTRYRPERAEHVARAFQAAGYRTGGFVGTNVLSGRTGIRHGFERYDDLVDPFVCDTLAWGLVHDLQSYLGGRFLAFSNNGLPHWIQDFQRPGEDVLKHALEWIEEDDGRPWFCMINLYDAHWPYLPQGEGKQLFVGPYDGPMDGYLFRSDAWREDYAIQPADKAHLVDLYDAEIHDLDGIVDRFLGQLDLDGGGTAVLMTADHGEAFGEAGVWKHEDVFEHQVHVPFVLRTAEATPEGRRVPGYVSGIDVAPTLLGLAGLGELAAELAMDGVDLTAADPDPERVILVEDRDHMDPREVTVVLYSGPWKLVRRGLGEEAGSRLFDLRNDALGTEDVSEENPQVHAELLARLNKLRAEADIEDAEGPNSGLSGGLLEGLAGLGYTGR